MQQFHPLPGNLDRNHETPITIAGKLSTQHVADVVEWLNAQDPSFARGLYRG